MKFILFLHRQEKLLYIAFYVLMNLAEDIAIETKMVQLSIVKYITKILHRTNLFRTWLDELFILLLIFLKKLTLFQENMRSMIDNHEIVHILIEIVKTFSITEGVERPDLKIALVKLLLNLSFDDKCKQQICEHGLLGWIIEECLIEENTFEFAIKILYNLSMNDEHRSQIAFTSTIAIVIQKVCPLQIFSNIQK